MYSSQDLRSVKTDAACTYISPTTLLVTPHPFPDSSVSSEKNYILLLSEYQEYSMEHGNICLYFFIKNAILIILKLQPMDYFPVTV